MEKGSTMKKFLALFFTLFLVASCARGQNWININATSLFLAGNKTDVTNWMKLIAPSQSLGGITITLPATLGLSGYLIQTDGAGNWSYIAPGSVDPSSNAVIINPATANRNLIQPTANSVNPLQLKQYSSSTSDLLDLLSSGNHDRGHFQNDGTFWVTGAGSTLQEWQYDNGSSISSMANLAQNGVLSVQGAKMQSDGSVYFFDVSNSTFGSMTAPTTYGANRAYTLADTDGTVPLVGANGGLLVAGSGVTLTNSGATTTIAATGSGGTVTSFSSGNFSPLFTTSVATATTTPALSFSAVNQNANLVFAGPTSGSAAAPTFRSLVAADLPDLSGSYIKNGTSQQTSANFNIYGASANYAGLINGQNTSGTSTALGIIDTTTNSGHVNQGITFNVSHGSLNWDMVGTNTSWEMDSAGHLTLGSGSGGATPVTGSLTLDNSASSHTTKIQAGNATADVTYTLPTADGSGGFVLQTNGGGVLSWTAQTTGSSHGEAIYGDGSDGSVTFDGTSTVLGLVPASSTYTLTRDITCAGIVVSSGVTIKSANFRIFCTGTLTDSGTIQVNGGNASGTTRGSNVATAFFGASQLGANGKSVTGAGNAGGSIINSAGGAGGAGGSDGGANTGGAGGTITLNANLGSLHSPSLWGCSSVLANIVFLSGGGGGGSGGLTISVGSPTSGAGGGGGGVIFIAASTLVNRGTISANGGNGSNAVDSGGDNGGGGGGGGGGGICLIYDSYTNSGTVSANGGTHGNGIGTGTNGSDGSNGTIVTIQN